MTEEQDIPGSTGAIYHGQHFTDSADLEGRLEDSLFRYSSLSRFSLDGGHVTSTFLSTAFDKVDWYWGLFNVCLFVDCRFSECTFRGTSFPGCRFVDCVFADCRFGPDNLGGECLFGGAKWYGCLQSGCEGLPAEVPSEQAKRRGGRRSRRWRR